jgi:tetratricopeptide (TPR) repeat protein
MSRYLSRLEAAVRAASEPVERAELSARMACALARLGRLQEARAIVAELRRHFGDGRSGRVTVWAMLAEGLIDCYGEISPVALDRITRAQVLSRAFGFRSVFALASAWKAHIEFEMSNFDAMGESIETAIRGSTKDDLDARARIAILLSCALALCGDLNQSGRWFMRGREYALLVGDDTSIEALQYNRAVMGLARLRTEVCMREVSELELRRVRLEFETSRNLQSLTRVDTFLGQMQICDARLHVLEGRFDRAVDIFRRARDEAVSANPHFNRAYLDLEIAYCLFKLGAVQEARAVHEPIAGEYFGGLDIDEQLVAAWMRARMIEEDPEWGDRPEAAQRLLELEGCYAASKAALEASLRPFQSLVADF